MKVVFICHSSYSSINSYSTSPNRNVKSTLRLLRNLFCFKLSRVFLSELEAPQRIFNAIYNANPPPTVSLLITLNTSLGIDNSVLKNSRCLIQSCLETFVTSSRLGMKSPRKYQSRLGRRRKKKGDKKIPSLILSIEANAISVFDLTIYIMNQGKFFTLLI